MDDEFGWGSDVWATSDPAEVVPPTETMSASTKARPPSIEVGPPPTPFADEAGFDDFDDFSGPAMMSQDDTADNDDFGDFEDFEEAGEPGTSFPDVESFPLAGPSSWKPLQTDPLPSRHVLRQEVWDILGPIWENEDISRVTTDDPMREVEGIGQILITPTSRDMYKVLLQTNPSTRPPNWTRSRIRRQHLISLGIPVNLDEVLPRAAGKPLPTLEIHTRPASTPPTGRSQSLSLSASRSGTPQPGPRNRIAAQFGPKPTVDAARLSKLMANDEEWLKMQSLPTLEQQLNELKMQRAKVSELLTYLLQSRDALQQDSETYNGLIGELVSEVAQKVRSGKPGLTRTMSVQSRR